MGGVQVRNPKEKSFFGVFFFFQTLIFGRTACCSRKFGSTRSFSIASIKHYRRRARSLFPVVRRRFPCWSSSALSSLLSLPLSEASFSPSSWFSSRRFQTYLYRPQRLSRHKQQNAPEAWKTGRFWGSTRRQGPSLQRHRSDRPLQRRRLRERSASLRAYRLQPTQSDSFYSGCFMQMCEELAS